MPAVQKKPAKWLIPAIIVGSVVVAAVVYFAFFSNSGRFLSFRKTEFGMTKEEVKQIMDKRANCTSRIYAWLIYNKRDFSIGGIDVTGSVFDFENNRLIKEEYSMYCDNENIDLYRIHLYLKNNFVIFTVNHIEKVILGIYL